MTRTPHTTSRIGARGITMIAASLVATVLVVTAGTATVAEAKPASGDGVGLHDPTTGIWHLLREDGLTSSFYYGNPGDIAMFGDWNCDGVDTPGLYRQSDGYVYLRNSNTQGVADVRFYFGNPADLPLAGDFNGNGCDTVSLWRPSEARVYVIDKLGSGNAGLGAADHSFTFGDFGDIPFVGDFNGDGNDTVGLYRPDTSQMFLRNALSAGAPDAAFTFGAGRGDLPLSGDWTGNGSDTIGTFRARYGNGSSGALLLRDTNTPGPPDRVIVAGTAGWRPFSGTFAGAGTPTVPVPPPTVPPPPGGGGWWDPPAGLSWQWQLSGTVDTSVDAEVFNVDLFVTPQSVINDLHAKGRKVICYMSAGSYEDFRPDAHLFPESVKGNSNGWPGEQWLDIRRVDILGPIMEARLDLCAAKGFDGVEFDNIDGYSNSSGFSLSARDQTDYNLFLAGAAHERGLAAGHKNNLDQAAAQEPYFDFAVNEECFTWNECGTLSVFINADKPVFHTEYDHSTSAFCPQTTALGFSSIKKRLSLDAWVQFCP